LQIFFPPLLNDFSLLSTMIISYDFNFSTLLLYRNVLILAYECSHHFLFSAIDLDNLIHFAILLSTLKVCENKRHTKIFLSNVMGIDFENTLISKLWIFHNFSHVAIKNFSQI